jgi:membrane-bound serine protease (ClpP class)
LPEQDFKRGWLCPVRSVVAILTLVGVFLHSSWGLVAPADAQRSGADGPTSRSVLLLDISGAIGFVAASRLEKAVERGGKENVEAIIVRMDTPGGLVSSTRVMIRTILASKVPIVVYVAPSGARAASAGTYLAYAAHVSAMAPGTHLGAATPISLGAPGLPSKNDEDKDKSGKGGSASERKVLNDAVAYIRSLAQLRGRNAAWAEKAVRDAATLTSEEAQKEKVVDLVIGDVAGLLDAIDGRTVSLQGSERRLRTKGLQIKEIASDWKMELMSAITDPNIAFILLMIGVYGIIFEFWSPGAVAPGVIGGISLLLALTALSVLPVSYGGLALLLFGAGLMLAEGFAPGFGLLGIGGLVAFVLGAIFLFDTDQSTLPIRVAWPVIAGVTAASAGLLMGVLGFALQARRKPVRTGAEEMIGADATVKSWSGENGLVHVHGETWSASSTLPLEVGQRVRVTGRERLLLSVEAKTPDGAST